MEARQRKTSIVLPFQVFCLLCWHKPKCFSKKLMCHTKKNRLCFARVTRGSIELRIVWEMPKKMHAIHCHWRLKWVDARTNLWTSSTIAECPQFGSTCTRTRKNTHEVAFPTSEKSTASKCKRKAINKQFHFHTKTKKKSEKNSQTYQLKHTHKQKSTPSEPHAVKWISIILSYNLYAHSLNFAFSLFPFLSLQWFSYVITAHSLMTQPF